MRNGWVKLHTRIIDSEILKDPVGLQVFVYLLARAYDDKSQPLGKLVTSRQQIAEAIGGNSNTVYKALKRLEKRKMVTTSATTKYTQITVVNWGEYQVNGNSTGNNEVTTKQQQSNSLNRIKIILLT